MAIKYFCDGCANEIAAASKIDPRPIATIETIDPSKGSSTSEMLCKECTPKLGPFIKGLATKE